MEKRFALVVLALICLRFSKFVVLAVLLVTCMLITRRQSRSPGRVKCEPIVDCVTSIPVDHKLNKDDKLDKEFLELTRVLVRKYIRNWFEKLSQDPAFPNAIEASLDASFARLVERTRLIDWQNFLSCKCLPLIVRHFNDYVRASEKIMTQRKHAKARNPEFHAERLASVYEYLHPGINNQEKTEAVVYEVAEMLFDRDLLDFLPCKYLLRDILKNIVLKNTLDTFCDSDFINQKIIEFADRQLADVEKATRMRRVIQQSLSASHILPKVSMDSHPAEHERFLQEVASITSHDIAKQLESSVDTQLKVLEGAAYKPANALFKRRLEESKKAIEKRLTELSPQPQPRSADADLRDVMADPKFSYAFQQFMAGQHDARYQLYRDIVDVHRSFIDPMGDVDTKRHISREDIVNAKGVCRRALLAKFKMDEQSKHTIRAFVESDNVSHDLFLNTERALWVVKDDLAKELASCLTRFKASPNYEKYLQNQLADVNDGGSTLSDSASAASLLENNVSREKLTGDIEQVFDTNSLQSTETEFGEDELSSDEDLSLESGELRLNYEERLRQVLLDIEQIERQRSLVSTLLEKAQLNNDEHEVEVFKRSEHALKRELTRKKQLKSCFLERLRTQQLYGKVQLSIERWATFNDGAGEYTTYLVDVKSCEDSDSGWVIPRRFSQFYELRKILKKQFPQVADMDFPAKRSVLRFQSKHFIEARMSVLNQFMAQTSKDEAICNHLAFRMFLSSYHFPESYFEVSRASDVLKNGSLPKGHEYVTAVDSVCGAFLTLFNIDQKTDWIKGKAIVTVVHQVLGSTIEKRINEAISNMVNRIPQAVHVVTNNLALDEPMPKEQRSYAQKLRTREYADELCYRLIRHYFAPIIGPARTRYGKNILMQILQNEKFNRYLFLGLIDLLVQELLLVAPSESSDPIT